MCSEECTLKCEFLVLDGKLKKRENTVLCYKKGLKVENNMVFEKFRR